MKRIIKNTILLLLIFILSAKCADAITITGGAASATFSGSNSSSQNMPSNLNENGTIDTKSTTNDHTAFIGVLLSLIDYQNTNGPEEKTLAKLLYVSGPVGSYRSQFETENYYHYGDYNDFYFGPNGRNGCGTKDYHNRSINHMFFEVEYDKPQLSPSLIGVPQKLGYSFTGISLDQTVEGLLIGEILDEYDKFGTIIGYKIDEREFDKYYLKYEPVYRTFPGIMRYDEAAASAGGQPYVLKDLFEPNLSDDTSPPDDATVVQGQVKYMPCEHEAREVRDDCICFSPRSYSTEEDCSAARYEWRDSACYARIFCDCPDDDDPNHYVNYQCYIYAAYNVSTYRLNHVPNVMGTVRDRYTGSSNLRSALYSSYSLNQHEVVDETTGLLLDGDDYYIGTTPNNAIAISDNGIHKFDPTKHKYKLVSAGNESYDPSKTLGMALYNLSDIIDREKKNDWDCNDECGNITDKSSSDYLRCAQTYCDSHIQYSKTEYATDNKRKCILDKCNYTPKTPIDCDNPVDNKIISEASADGTDGKTINNSSCGFTGSDHNKDNRTVDKQRGSYYFCQRMGNAVKSTDSKGKTYYKYGVSNTVDSYINIECKESAGFDFKDLSKNTIKQGTGFEYSTYLDGSKTCRIFFDTVSWEFDFASTHSLDTIRKKLLLQKVNAFNMLEANKSGGIKVNGSELLGKVIDQEGTTEKLTLDDVEDDLIFLSALNYNITDAKASSKSKVTEYIDKKSDTSGNNVYEEGEKFNLEIEKKHVSTSYNSEIKQDGLNLYHEYNFDESRQLNEEGTRNINTYNVESSGSISYYLPQLCLAADNRRTIKRTNEGSCDALGSLYNKSVPLRQYYTSLKAEQHDTLNNMNNVVSVKKSYFNDTVIESDEYLKGEDTCPYKIPIPIPIPGEGYASCEIFIEKSATCYKSNDLYISSDPNIKARLIVSNKTNDAIDIDSQKIELAGSSISGVKEISFPASDLATTTTSSGKVKSDTKVDIIGTLKLKSNDSGIILTSDTVTCEKEINIIKSASSCTITKDGTSYWVTPNGSDDVYATTGSQLDANGELVFKELTHKENGKYLFQVISDSKDDVVIAKVMDGTNTNYCTYVPTNCPELSACRELFTQDQSKAMRDYCNENYEIDKYHYDSPEACFNDCSTSCIDCDRTKKYCIIELTAKEREGFNTVDAFCNSTDSAQVYDDCMNECLEINPPGSGDNPLYRPINLNNPFPSSKFSAESGYQGGKRAIGQEWLIHYNKIMEDKAEVMNGTEPEYVVDLDIARINAIRYDTNTRNEGLMSGSIYSDTTNLPKVASCTSTGYKGYCSSFIHEDFTDYFKIVMGHKN